MSDREERWVERFDELRNLGREERGRRLDELARSDPEMAQDLRELLEAHDQEPGFLERDEPTDPRSSSWTAGGMSSSACKRCCR